jgi:hypothetical protein
MWSALKDGFTEFSHDALREGGALVKDTADETTNLVKMTPTQTQELSKSAGAEEIQQTPTAGGAAPVPSGPLTAAVPASDGTTLIPGVKHKVAPKQKDAPGVAHEAQAGKLKAHLEPESTLPTAAVPAVPTVPAVPAARAPTAARKQRKDKDGGKVRPFMLTLSNPP